MEELSIGEVVSAVGGELIRGTETAKVGGVNTDTRCIKRGDLFFALSGENADGHAYVGKAVEGGAAGVVVSDAGSVPAESDCAVIVVSDPLRAMGDLAKYYRSRFDVVVIGVTGSVGKTTTKEMLAAVLERKWKTLRNRVNYNNEIGVPLTLFELNREHQMCVIEMGMRGLGEIRRLAEIAQPELGVITNVGMSHIERLGSQGAIAQAKSELLEELPPDGVAVLNAEDGYFTMIKERWGGKVVSFGFCADADVRADRLASLPDGRYTFRLCTNEDCVDVTMPMMGRHNVQNALAAAAAASAVGLGLDDIRDGLESFDSPSMRMELVKASGGYTVLNDAYNAGPASMIAALDTIAGMTGYKRKIAVLGDMLELGEYSARSHSEVGRSAADSVDLLITVGVFSADIAAGAVVGGMPESSVSLYANSAEAAAALKGLVAPGDLVLVKGSRAMRMEEIVRALTDE